jgi:hypothetical protein
MDVCAYWPESKVSGSRMVAIQPGHLAVCGGWKTERVSTERERSSHEVTQHSGHRDRT